VTPREDAVFAAAMTFVGCHEADPAVSMFAVIPADEALDPSPIRSIDTLRRECRLSPSFVLLTISDFSSSCLQNFSA
jgi:hypothetical protein